MSQIRNLYVSAERLRSARPDSVRHIDQLVAGQIVMRFSTYADPQGIINIHHTHLAVVEGMPFRIVDAEIVDRGLSKYMHVEGLPAFTLKEREYETSPAPRLCVVGRGIEGVDKYAPHVPFSMGLLAVREDAGQSGKNLQVGPGLYVDGRNDYQTLFTDGFMAVALDADSRLAGQLPGHC